MKKNNRWIFMSLIVLVTGITIITMYWFSYKNEQSKMEGQRHLLFCKILTPGLNKDAILERLSQFGELKYSDEFPQGKGITEMLITFTDKEKILGANGYIIFFENGKYLSASMITDLDRYEDVCGLSTP